MKCLVCKQSEPCPGLTTVTLERGEFSLVLKNVPALVCPECGEAYTDESTAARILETALEMEDEGLQNLPRAILLEDPPAFWRFDRSAPPAGNSRNDLKEWVISNKRKTRDDLLAEAHANNPNWPEVELEPWVNAKHRYSPKVGALVPPQDLESLNFPELIKHITSPAIFISSEPEWGAASSEEDIVKLKELLPQLRVMHVAGAGHNIRRDQFERYMEIVEQVLAAFQEHSVC